jgi:predicted dienelactone hydrolase
MNVSLERIALASTVGLIAFKAIKGFLKLSHEEHEFVSTAGLSGGRKNRKEFFGLGLSEFLNDQGLLISYRTWIPEKITQGIVILSHGFAGHSGRYEHVALELQRKGFAVYAIDHQGHGQSEGDRAYVPHFSYYASDLIQLTRIAKRVHKDKSRFYLIVRATCSLTHSHTHTHSLIHTRGIAWEGLSR